jgi:lysophospholipase L1-like esterase
VSSRCQGIFEESQVERRKLGYYLIGSIVVVLLFFVTIEIVTRTISWSSGKGFTLALHELDPTDKGVTDIYQWHPFTGFTFRPNTVFTGSHPNRREEARIFVDQHGFLAKDQGLALEKSANEIRIATIGASTTANISLEFDDNWPGQLGFLVQQSLPAKTIRIINAAVPGFDTSQSIGNLALRVMPFKPDIVIIYHAYNDMKAVQANAEFRPDYLHIHHTPYGYHKKPPFFLRWLNQSMFYVRMRNSYRNLETIQSRNEMLMGKNRLASIPAGAETTFGQHIQSLIGIARVGGAKIVLSSFATLHDPALDYTDEKNVKFTKLQGVELVSLMHFTPGLTIDGIFEGFNRDNSLLKRIAAQEKVGWVDNATLIPHKDEYFVDRVHFSKAGAAEMAKNFLPVVLEQLKR